MSQVSVRYVVDDAAAATSFYRDLLGFEVERTPAPGFAMLTHGDLRHARPSYSSVLLTISHTTNHG